MTSILKKTTLFLFCLFCTLSLSAQINLNKAKKALKDKTEKPEKPEPQKTTRSSEKQTPSTTEQRRVRNPISTEFEEDHEDSSENAGSDDKYKPSTVSLDFESEPFSPCIVWANLLYGGWYYNITNGELKLSPIQVSFLPKKTKDGTPVRYESYSNDIPLLRMEIWDTKSNTLKSTMHYEAKPATAPFYDMMVLETHGFQSFTNLFEGSYELRFWAGTQQFYSFPFSIEKQSNPDPYAPVHDFYFLKGAWEDWGRVEFGSDGHFIFNFYLTHESTTIPNQAQWDARKANKYLVKLYREGKMVAVHSIPNSGTGFEEGDIYTRNGKWERFDCTLHKYPLAKPGNREVFNKSDMKDGNYTVELWLKNLEGQETTHKYSFTMKNGTVVADPKADRSLNKDPFHLLEQAPGQFYIRKN